MKKNIVPVVVLVVFLGFFAVDFFQNKAEIKKKQQEKTAKFTDDSLKQKNDSLVKVFKEKEKQEFAIRDSLAKSRGIKPLQRDYGGFTRRIPDERDR